MRTIKIIAFVLFACCWYVLSPVASKAQTKTAQQQALKIAFQEIKNLKAYGYHYSLQVVFPDSTSEQLKGEVFINNAKNVMYQQNKSFTLLYTGDWFYKANHLSKEVTIINVTKYFGKEVKDYNVDELFNGKISNEYIDSFILKFATVTSFVEKGNVQQMELKFPKQAGAITSMKLSYDTQLKLLVSLEMHTYYPYQGGSSGYRQIIKCDQYSKAVVEKSMDAYFTRTGDQAVLKQYKQYKLNALL